jgi:hypothetical protein
MAKSCLRLERAQEEPFNNSSSDRTRPIDEMIGRRVLRNWQRLICIDELFLPTPPSLEGARLLGSSCMGPRHRRRDHEDGFSASAVGTGFAG